MDSETTEEESTLAPAENGRTEATPPTQAVAAAHRPRVVNFLGRHRLSATIGRLHQEIQFLKSELEELDKLEQSSAACKDKYYSYCTVEFSLLWNENRMLCFPSPKVLRILHGRDGSSQLEARGTANGGTVETQIFLN